MDAFLDFFETMPVWQKLLWVIGCLLFTFALENSFPLIQFKYKKWKHAGVNFVFLGFTLVINVVFGLATVGVFDWIAAHQVGLLFMITLPTWVELIMAVMLFDLVAQYTAHYLLHRVKWMWKLHMVHHSDTMVDATTGTRHHPGDYIIREVFALAAACVIGAPFAFYMVYRICTVFFTYTSHANITMPLWLDKSLSIIFITPNMHKFHHHVERPWTDTNFGNIFSLWDRAFGTMVYDDPKKVTYGLDVLAKTPDEDVLFQLKVPFNKNIKTDY